MIKIWNPNTRIRNSFLVLMSQNYRAPRVPSLEPRLPGLEQFCPCSLFVGIPIYIRWSVSCGGGIVSGKQRAVSVQHMVALLLLPHSLGEQQEGFQTFHSFPYFPLIYIQFYSILYFFFFPSRKRGFKHMVALPVYLSLSLCL